MSGQELEPIRVLVVEDNLVDVKLIRFALQGVEKWTLTFDVLEDGEQAIEYLKKEAGYAGQVNPDLVVLDLNLPKRDGTEVLRTIRRDSVLKDLKVVVLSSSPKDVIEERVRDLDLAPDCCFTKPLGLEEFLALGEEIYRCYLDQGGREHVRRAGV